MKLSDEIYAALTIFPEEGDPHLLTDKLRISPDKCWKKGDMYTRESWDSVDRAVSEFSSPKHRSLWEVNTKELVDSEDIVCHVRYLVEMLRPRLQAIYDLLKDRSEYTIWICLWVSREGGHTSHAIPSDLMAQVLPFCHEIYITLIARQDEDADGEDNGDDGGNSGDGDILVEV